MRKLIVAVVIAAAGTTACTSSRPAASPTPTTPTVAATTTTTTTTPSFTGSSTSPFCEVAGRAPAVFAWSSFTTKTPVQLKAIYANVGPALDRARADSPAVIGPDVTAFVAALRTILGPLAAAEYNFENLNPTTYAIFATPPVTAASDRIEQYLRQVCRSAGP